ncbi:MAG: hypothetical protein GWN64_07715 [Candidatus Thorarchaeota archaeon]|nr:hypothetical protein [Candidatus Thorarchaeota archaeon]
MKTKIFMGAVTGIAIIGNIILIATDNSSISQEIVKLTGEYPMVAVIIGVVIGHWFWPVRKK